MATLNGKNSEQALLDACWSGTTVGKKLKNKLMERLERNRRVKQFCPPPIGSRPKTPAQFNSTAKKNKMNNLILMVQETNYPKHHSKIASCRNKDLTQSFGPSPYLSKRKIDLNSTYTNNPSSSSASHKLQNSLMLSSTTQGGLRRDASAYLTLRDQLNKLTMDIQADCSLDESLNSVKQRRTREERRKGGNVNKEKPEVNKGMKKCMSNVNCAQLFGREGRNVLSVIPNNMLSGKQRAKSGAKQPIIQRNFKKPTMHNVSKENTKPNLNPIIKTIPNSNKKIATDPKKYLVRKYLGELYTKIAFKVKEIERKKKDTCKKTLERCGTSKNELLKVTRGRKGLINANPKKAM